MAGEGGSTGEVGDAMVDLRKAIALMDEAAPGPWLYRHKSETWHKPPPEGTTYQYGYPIEDTGEALIAAVTCMRTHAATILAALEAAALPVAAHLDEQRPFPLPKPFKRAPVAAPMGGDAVEALRVAFRHIDIKGLRISHRKDAALIESALAATPAPPPAMQAEIDRLRADAERYDWLRNPRGPITTHVVTWVERPGHPCGSAYERICGGEMDTLIDAARARDAGEVEGG